MKVNYPELDDISLRELWTLVLHEDDRTVRDLMSHYTSLHELSCASVDELQHLAGLDGNRAMQIRAVLALAKRIASCPPVERPVVCSPGDVSNLLMPTMRFLNHEEFACLCLNAKNRVLSIDRISMGSLTASLVHPRELFKKAILKSSAAIVLAHNHPSGDPNPSDDDLKLTKRLKEAGELLGIQVLDHVIIGDGRYVSLKERGVI